MTLDAESTVASGRASSRFRRWLSVLVGLSALAATLLSLAESDAGGKEERALVQASRQSLEIFMRIAASAPKTQFEGDAARRASFPQIEAAAQVLNSPQGQPLELATALFEAEEKVGASTTLLAQAMSNLPPSARGVDAAMLEALNTELGDFTPLVEAQNASTERADRYGTRQQRSMFGLAVVAIAGSLLGLAGLIGSGRAGRIALVTAGVALSVAVLSGASGYVG